MPPNYQQLKTSLIDPNCQIETLNLSNEQITDGWLRGLMNDLRKYNHSVKRLILRNNIITNSGAYYVSFGLRTDLNPVERDIIEIDLSGNYISDQDLMADIEAALTRNRNAASTTTPPRTTTQSAISTSVITSQLTPSHSTRRNIPTTAIPATPTPSKTILATETTPPQTPRPAVTTPTLAIVPPSTSTPANPTTKDRTSSASQRTTKALTTQPQTATSPLPAHTPAQNLSSSTRAFISTSNSSQAWPFSTPEDRPPNEQATGYSSSRRQIPTVSPTSTQNFSVNSLTTARPLITNNPAESATTTAQISLSAIGLIIGGVVVLFIAVVIAGVRTYKKRQQNSATSIEPPSNTPSRVRLDVLSMLPQNQGSHTEHNPAFLWDPAAYAVPDNVDNEGGYDTPYGLLNLQAGSQPWPLPNDPRYVYSEADACHSPYDQLYAPGSPEILNQPPTNHYYEIPDEDGKLYAIAVFSDDQASQQRSANLPRTDDQGYEIPSPQSPIYQQADPKTHPLGGTGEDGYEKPVALADQGLGSQMMFGFQNHEYALAAEDLEPSTGNTDALYDEAMLSPLGSHYSSPVYDEADSGESFGFPSPLPTASAQNQAPFSNA